MSLKKENLLKRKLVVKIKSISKFTAYDAAKLKKLTISDHSHMMSFLRWIEAKHTLRSYGVKCDDIRGFVSVGYAGKQLVGWCLIHYQTKKDNVMSVSTYVDVLHRRQGYGAELYQKLIDHVHIIDKRENLEVKHFAFDKAGNRFYKKLSFYKGKL